MSVETHIVQVTNYQLTASAEAFVAAITALSERSRQEGPRDIIRYSFYVNPDEGTAGAVIIYRNAGAWLAQHELVASLEEYPKFYQTVRLVGLQLFGDISPEIRQFFDERRLAFTDGGRLAAGFER
jgi:hypothetical protein